MLQPQRQDTSRQPSPAPSHQQSFTANDANKRPTTPNPQPSASPAPSKTVHYQNQQPQQPPPQQVVVIIPARNQESQSTAAEHDQPWAGSSFNSKKVRHAFIRKVYLLLSVMLIVTGICICIFLYVEPVKKWVHANSWFVWVSFGVYLVTYLILVCFRSVRRYFPANFICLAIFNLAFSYVCAALSSYYSTEIVLIAVAITIGVCVAVTLFAIQTRIDFTMCTGLLFVLSMVLMIFGFAVLIVYIVSGPNYILRCVYGGVASLVFALFLAYDTQMIIGGRRYQLSAEEYISGALELYMDVGSMYLIVLSFFNIGG